MRISAQIGQLTNWSVINVTGHDKIPISHNMLDCPSDLISFLFN